MPASVAREDQRVAKLLPALFWSGVGLTPIAALALLIGSGTGSLRFAVALVLLAMVLIGLSIVLRRDSEHVRADVEDTLFEEIDVMRGDVRDDIAHAVQATHRAFGEKMQYLMDQLEATRAELESTRAQLEIVKQSGPARVGPGGSRLGVPPGLVRHTETVQVTTRHTVMDEDRGTTYGSRHAVNGQRPSGNSHGDEQWNDRRRDVVEPVSAGGRRQEQPYEQPYEQHWSQQVADDDRPGLRAGDRWASVRQDEHGRELRMGERRAAMHHDGYGGTELRIEDRWAAVRREAGLDNPGWGQQPYDDRDYRDRRAITGSDRQERWSDYRDDYRDDYQPRYR